MATMVSRITPALDRESGESSSVGAMGVLLL
jgi:hypothetical protein